jgi:hypothetical protein
MHQKEQCLTLSKENQKSPFQQIRFGRSKSPVKGLSNDADLKFYFLKLKHMVKMLHFSYKLQIKFLKNIIFQYPLFIDIIPNYLEFYF